MDDNTAMISDICFAQIKNVLLGTSYIIDNVYLDKYVALVVANIARKKEKFVTQKHHIVPKCFFKYDNLPIDNSVKNIVNLRYKDHIFAHYYLCLCVNDEPLKHACIISFLYLKNGKYANIPNTQVIRLNESCTDDKFEFLQEIYTLNKKLQSKLAKKRGFGTGQHTPCSTETRRRMSMAHKGRPAYNKGVPGKKHSSEWKKIAREQRKGKIYVTDGTQNKSICLKDLSIWTEKGWRRGRTFNTSSNKSISKRKQISNTLIGHQVSDETKQKIRQALSGRTNPNNHTTHQYTWITNGLENKMCKKTDVPMFLSNEANWHVGRTIKRKETQTLK